MKERSRENRQISLSGSHEFAQFRCEPLSVGRDTETDPRTYAWDNRNRGPFALLQYTLEGEGRFRDEEGREYIVGQEQAFLVHCPSDTRYWLASGCQWTFLYVIFAGDMARHHVEQLIRSGGHILHLPLQSPAVESLRRIHEESTGGLTPDTFIRSAWVYRMIMELYRQLRPRNDIPAGIHRALRRIEQEFRNSSLRLDDLAKASGMSRFHFAHLFCKHVGVSPVEYILKARMDQAMDYLISTDLSIKEISRLVGYNDVSYFCRAFRQRYRMSPGQARTPKAK